MSTAHRLLDKLVEDLKTELFARMHEYIVVELEKREKALQNMVEEMLAEHKAKMLEVFLDKVKDEVQMFAVGTNDAMDSFFGEMKCQLHYGGGGKGGCTSIAGQYGKTENAMQCKTDLKMT